MNSKVFRLALHLIALTGFLLMQGCATRRSPIDWLNWPYGSSPQTPPMYTIDEYPVEQIEEFDFPEPILLPPEITSEIYVAPEPIDTSAQVYVVKKGDSLAKIASMHGVSWKTLAKENNISNPNAIMVGQEIRISGGDVESEAQKTVDVTGKLYVVKKGDTLSCIASKYDCSWRKVAEHNQLSNPGRLVVGQKIRIPGLSGAVKPVARLESPAPKKQKSSKPSKPSKQDPIKQGSSYVVQRGDSLSKIANRAGLSVDEIKAKNALTSNRIIAGKSLSIPKKGEINVTDLPESSTKPTPEPTPESAPKPAPVEEKKEAPELAPLADLAPLAPASSAPLYEHVLYPGETLEDVARQFGSSPKEIMELNGITDPSVVTLGTKLLIPLPN